MIIKLDGVYTMIWEIQHTAVKHGGQRCRDCGHIFEVNEAFIFLPTSTKRYSSYYSKFCLPCVNKILMKDEDRISEELDRAEQREIERKRADLATRQR